MLDWGVWKQTQRFVGPFANYAQRAYVLPLSTPPLRRIWNSGDDSGRSDLQLWVNNREWGAAHAPGATILAGATAAYIHWNYQVFFSLPDTVANDQSTTAMVTYTVRLRPSISLIILIVTGVIGLITLMLTIALRAGGGERSTLGQKLQWRSSIKQEFQRCGMRYLRCGIIPTIADLCWIPIPPLWTGGTDSIVILMWPGDLIPHYPFLYPAFVVVVESTLGLNSTSLYAMLFIQHAMLLVAMTYLAAAFQRMWESVVISVFMIIGLWFGAYSHAIGTEPFDSVFLVLLGGTLIRFWRYGWCTRTAAVFAVAAFGLSSTRHISVIVSAIVPLYFLFRALLCYLDRGSSLRHALCKRGYCFLCGAGGKCRKPRGLRCPGTRLYLDHWTCRSMQS